jgi:hypothetical protein
MDRNRSVSRTNGDWLDFDTLFDVRSRRIVRIFVMKNLLAAKGVHECGATWDENG